MPVKRIAVVTDSTSDLYNLKGRDNIYIVPLYIIIGNKKYKDMEDLSLEDFYKILAGGKVLPKTSQPSPEDFKRCYKKLFSEGYDEIISLHLSSKLSGTANSAGIAKKELGSGNIHVFDTRLTTKALGLLVLKISEFVKIESDINVIGSKIESLINATKIYFTVNSLLHLERGGRIGKTGLLIGSLLNIKPVLTLTEGEILPVIRARGQKNLVEILLSKAGEFIGSGETQVYLLHTGDSGITDILRKSIANKYKNAKIETDLIGAVIGTHIGPGSTGVIMLKS